MYKVIILVVCLSSCLSLVQCDLNKKDGEDCEWEGVQGKCVHPRVCLTSLDERGAKPPVCSGSGVETIICCTDCELVNDTRNFILDPSSGAFWKDGRKSRDACLQYLKEQPHICYQQGYYAGISRQLDTERQCHTYSLWAVGGAPGPGARIPRENPYEAVIGFGESQDATVWLSAGAIIHERFILTSAHQLNASKGRPLKYVALGVKNMDRKSWQIINVKSIYIHPEFEADRTRYNDIALLELETPITFTRDILPACLPDPAEEFDTTKAKITSWLRNDKDPSTPGPYDSPHVVELKQFTTEDCNAKMEELDTGLSYKVHLPQKVDGDTQVCYGTDICTYTIGVPLAVTTQYSRCMNTVIGVSAYERNNCSPAVFTKVKHYTPWIESIVWP